MDNVTSVLSILAGAAAVLAYVRFGTLKAAKETITILKEQIAALRDEHIDLKAKYETLTSQYETLQGIVSNAQPIRELTTWAKDMVARTAEQRAQEHLENVTSLTRLEGALARVERHLLGTHEGDREAV